MRLSVGDIAKMSTNVGGQILHEIRKIVTTPYPVCLKVLGLASKAFVFDCATKSIIEAPLSTEKDDRP